MLIRIAIDAHRLLKYFIRVLTTFVLFLLDALSFYDKRLHYFHILDSEQEIVNDRLILKKQRTVTELLNLFN